jgi:HAE1 family hydrophobic/amphiphilic exporter-1
VVPLVIATGAGAELRRSLGVTVFSGMIGVTLFGLLFTPAFYAICSKLAGRSGAKEVQRSRAGEGHDAKPII